MCLCLCSRTESDARDSITSHNGYAVCGECPFICKWACFSHFFCFSISKTGFTVQVFVCVFKSFCYFVIFRNSPCREVALDFVFAACVGRTIIVIHGYNNVITVFLNAWKCTDLIQAAFPCFSECHTTVKRYRTGVSYCTTARRGVENLRYSYSTASKETSLFPVRVKFWIEHFNKTFDLCFVSVIVFIKGTYVLKDISHFVDGVVTTFRSRTMAGNTLYIYADFHTSTLTSVDTTVSWLCGNYKFRTDLVFVDDVLPAETVTVFFLNRSDYHDLISFRNQIHVFHDSGTVYSRYETTALVRDTTSTDFFFCFVTFVWIEVPVFDVTDTNRIDMGIKSENLITGSHVTDDVTLWINSYFIEVQLFHFSFNCFDMFSFIAAFSRIFNDCS